MPILPAEFIHLLRPFAPLFHPKTWQKAQILLVGAILTPRKRTVTSTLRVMGLAEYANFSQYYHVLNRAVWSTLKLSRVLLYLMLAHLDHEDSPLVFGIDETLERRWGSRISARGIYAVRSSKSHLVKASGLRWISLMWLISLGQIALGHYLSSLLLLHQSVIMRRWDVNPKNSAIGRARSSSNCVGGFPTGLS